MAETKLKQPKQLKQLRREKQTYHKAAQGCTSLSEEFPNININHTKELTRCYVFQGCADIVIDVLRRVATRAKPEIAEKLTCSIRKLCACTTINVVGRGHERNEDQFLALATTCLQRLTSPCC